MAVGRFAGMLILSACCSSLSGTVQCSIPCKSFVDTTKLRDTLLLCNEEAIRLSLVVGVVASNI